MAWHWACQWTEGAFILLCSLYNFLLNVAIFACSTVIHLQWWQALILTLYDWAVFHGEGKKSCQIFVKPVWGVRIENPSLCFQVFWTIQGKTRAKSFVTFTPQLYNSYDHSHVPDPHMWLSPGPWPNSTCSKTMEVSDSVFMLRVKPGQQKITKPQTCIHQIKMLYMNGVLDLCFENSLGIFFLTIIIALDVDWSLNIFTNLYFAWHQKYEKWNVI